MLCPRHNINTILCPGHRIRLMLCPGHNMVLIFKIVFLINLIKLKVKVLFKIFLFHCEILKLGWLVQC